MASKGKFHIPSAAEMEKEPGTNAGIQASSLFASHRKTVQSNIAREKNLKSPQKICSQNTKSFSHSASAAVNSSVATKTLESQSIQKPSNSISTTSNSNNSLPVSAKKNTQVLPKFTLPTENKIVSGNLSVPVSTSDASSKSENIVSNAEGNKSSPSRPGNIHAVVVSARQRGNPLLKYIRNVPWEFGDIVADYQMGQSTCALFLSLRYHNLNPNYIHERLKHLGHSYNLRILLVQVDIKDPTHCLSEIAQMCILADCTLMLAFTAEEAGRYLETYKSFESKPPDLIMEKTEGNLISRMTDTLTSVKSVNKTDANTLLNTFGSFEKMVKASEEDLSFCPGFGPQKAKRLNNIFNEPFLKEKKRKLEESPLKGSPKKSSPQKKSKPNPS